jgi:NAD+ kinase
MRQIAIIYKRGRQDAAQFAEQLKGWIESKGFRVFTRENRAEPRLGETPVESPLPLDTDLVIVLGGDGTLLSVARLLDNRTTPIIGVNLGGLGFLTEIGQKLCRQDLEKVLDGNHEIEERMRLYATIYRDGQKIFCQPVLNDAVINKGALARIVDLQVTINDRHLTHYRADGLIVATPTGSTAYNLSAGGPIVYPTSQAIILTPICPFTLTNRPIILPPEMTVQVQIGEPGQDVCITCDGQIGLALKPDDRIVIAAAAQPLRLIKPPSTDYFEILRTKLKWGQN